MDENIKNSLNNIELLSYLDIYKILQSLKVQTSSLDRKVDLITKVKKYYEFIELEKKKNNNGGYNSIKFEFKIKEICKTESLFWKIIKNKYLFKIILSFLKTTSSIGTTTYNEVDSITTSLLTSITSKNYFEAIEVNWIIKNNHKELLKSKIKNQQYLIFPRVTDNSNSNNNNNSNCNQILQAVGNEDGSISSISGISGISSSGSGNNRINKSSIKNEGGNSRAAATTTTTTTTTAEQLIPTKIASPNSNLISLACVKETIARSSLSPIFAFIKDDKEFYRDLYKYHWKRMCNLKDRVIDLISNGCLAGLQVLIEDGIQQQPQGTFDKYLPNSSTLINSIKFNSFKIIKYLFNNFLSLFENGTIETKNQIWRLIFNTPIMLIKKRFKVLNYLVGTLNLQPPKDQPLYLVNLYRLCPFENNFTIKILLDSCKSIQILNISDILSSFSKNGGNGNSLLTTMIPLDELNSFSFTNDQLKLKLEESKHLFKDCNEKREIVNRLLLMYYSVLKVKNQKYYLLVKGENEYIEAMESDGISQVCIKNADLDSFRYGENKLLRKWFERNDFSGTDYNRFRLENRVSELFSKYELPTFLFQHCKNDREKQRQFILDIVRDCLDPAVNQENHLAPLFIFNLVLTTNDLEFIKLVFDSFGNELLDVPAKNFSNFNYNILRYVNSIPVLNFVLDNITNKPLCSIISLYRYGRVHLLEEFEKRYLKSSRLSIASTSTALSSFDDEEHQDNLEQHLINKIKFPALRINGGAATIISSPTINNNNNNNNSNNNNNTTTPIKRTIRNREDSIIILANEKVLKTARYVVSKPNIYQFDSYVIECWCGGNNISSPNWEDYDIEDIKFIIENTTYDYDIFKIHSTSPDGYEPFTNKQIELMDWIFKTRENDIISKRCKLSISILKTLLYLTGRGYQLFDKLILEKYIIGNSSSDSKNKKQQQQSETDIIFKDCERVLFQVAKRGDLNFINHFMEGYFSFFEKKKTVFEEKLVFETNTPKKSHKKKVEPISKLVSLSILNSIIDSIILPNTTSTTATTTTTTTSDKSPTIIVDKEMEQSESSSSSAAATAIITTTPNDIEMKLLSTNKSTTINVDEMKAPPPIEHCTSTSSDTDTNNDETIIGSITDYNLTLENAQLKTNPYGIEESSSSSCDDDDDSLPSNGFYMVDFKRGRSKKEDREDNKKRIKKLKLEKQIEKEKKEKEKKEKEDRDREKKLKKEKEMREKQEKDRLEKEEKEKKKKEKELKIAEKQLLKSKAIKELKANLPILPTKNMVSIKETTKTEVTDIEKQFLFYFLLSISRYGRLDIIKYLNDEFPVLLLYKAIKKNSKYEDCVNSIFNKGELKSMLFESLVHDHLELFDFLTFDNRMEVTSKQFRSYSIPSQTIYIVNIDKYRELPTNK